VLQYVINQQLNGLQEKYLAMKSSTDFTKTNTMANSSVLEYPSLAVLNRATYFCEFPDLTTTLKIFKSVISFTHVLFGGLFSQRLFRTSYCQIGTTSLEIAHFVESI
jgi:hypothetical protein